MKRVPFGVVLGQDNNEALVELIEARWREGKIPGPVLGRRGRNHMHEEIENYHWLEIQWVAAPPKGDYYDGEYENEVYAAPPLTNWEHVGTDYYLNEWKDLATTEQTLSRLRAEVSRPDLRPADARLHAHVKETSVAGKVGQPDDLRKLLGHNRTRSDQAMPDRADLRRLPEALTELRASVQTAVRTRQAPDVPADVVEEKMQQAREAVDAELIGCLARDQFVAFLYTTYGLERLPWGEYWLRPDGSPRPDATRAFIYGTAPSMRHRDVAGIVMVRSDDFRAFGAQYLGAHGLADPAFSSAAPDMPLNRHWKPLAEAIGVVARRRGVHLDQAWAMVKADIIAPEIKARCRAMRKDRQQGTWIETWRDFDPRWLDFVAYERPEDNHLRFDLATAARGQMAGEQIELPPEHARNIAVDAARLDELYAPATEENPPPSPLRHIEQTTTESESVELGDRKPVTRRSSRQKPFWPEARKAAFALFEESGFPCPGDGGQAKLEGHIAGWIMERGHRAAESTIRKHVKAWIEEYKASLSPV